MTAHLAALRAKVADRSARLAVIGLGYVGTPVACRFAEAGFRVVGVDIAADRVAALGAGRVPFEGEEPGLAELVARVVAQGRLQATTDPEALRDADVILVAVETPVEADTRRPRYDALRAALASLGPRLGPGRLVVIESTLAPGTMDQVVTPLLVETSGLSPIDDLMVVHCPERVMPGRLLANLAGMSRVVGGVTPEAAQIAAVLYRHVVAADLDVADALTAELVKAGENAYRDVQIAFANEMALVCEALGADVWRVRDLINKSPGRAMLLPGAGVGGHCIPKDPWLLVANVGGAYSARLIPAARAINDGMPDHTVGLVRSGLGEVGLGLDGAIVAVLGYAYLPDSDDDRNAPSAVVASVLAQAGAQVRIHDPWVPAYRDRTVEACVDGSDAVVVMVAHSAYRALDLVALRGRVRTPVLVDGRRVFDPAAARAAGWVTRTIGVGRSGGHRS
jgi:UDP-N-acetyl-D-mannosaminuronic acid dehydrogenase